MIYAARKTIKKNNWDTSERNALYNDFVKKKKGEIKLQYTVGIRAEKKQMQTRDGMKCGNSSFAYSPGLILYRDRDDSAAWREIFSIFPLRVLIRYLYETFRPSSE